MKKLLPRHTTEQKNKNLSILLSYQEQIKPYIKKSGRKKERAVNPKKLSRSKYITDHNGYINSLLAEFLEMKKKGRITTFKPLFNNVIANALNNSNSPILYSRNRLTDGLVQVIDFLSSKHLLTNVLAPQDSYSVDRVSSHFTGTILLKNNIGQFKYILSKDQKLIQFKDKDKKVIDAIPQKYNKKKISNETKFTKKYNNHIKKALIIYDGDQPVMPYIFQSFSVRDSRCLLGGRYYGSDIIQLSGAERLNITINSNPVVEVDYSNLHINMLYAISGNTPPAGDLYEFGDLPRKVNKQLLLRFINCDVPSLLKITNASKSETAKWCKEQYIKLGRPTNKFVKGIIDNIPANFSLGTWLISLLEKHNKIHYLFNKPDLALKLQRLDSYLIKTVMKDCISKKIYVLPVHDSVICEFKNSQIVTDIMKNCYENAKFNKKFYPIKVA